MKTIRKYKEYELLMDEELEPFENVKRYFYAKNLINNELVSIDWTPYSIPSEVDFELLVILNFPKREDYYSYFKSNVYSPMNSEKINKLKNIAL